jgi:hypothetical protein
MREVAMLSWKYDGYETWRRGEYKIYLIGGQLLRR